MDEQAHAEVELDGEQEGEPLAEAKKGDDGGFIDNSINL
jgi:hypothetical protein